MNKDLKNIDRLFHENLSASGEQPPVRIWEGIENALDVADAQVVSNKKEKRKRYAVAALLLAAAGITALLFSINNGEINSTAKTDPAIVMASANQTPQQINNQAPAPIEKTKQIKEKESVHQMPISSKAIAFNTKDNLTVAVQNERVNASVTGINENVKKERDIENSPHPLSENIQVALSESSQSTMLTIPLSSTVDRYHQDPYLMNVPEKLYAGNTNTAEKSIASLIHTKKQSRFSITAFFAPDITTRNLEQNFGITLDERKEELLRTEKNSQLDFTLGARAEYKLNKHLSLISGLSFSSNTIDIAQKTVFARFDKDGALKFRFNLSSGYTYFKPKTLSAPMFLGDSAQALSSSSTLHYINIPLALKYNIASGRFTFSVQAGVTARFITKQSIDAVYASNGTNEKSITNVIQGLKTNYFNGVVGLGADYSLSKTVALTFFPSFNFATTSINRDAPVKAYPNTLSIATGIKFTL